MGVTLQQLSTLTMLACASFIGKAEPHHMLALLACALASDHGLADCLRHFCSSDRLHIARRRLSAVATGRTLEEFAG
jgi:hypothetical protein